MFTPTLLLRRFLTGILLLLLCSGCSRKDSQQQFLQGAKKHYDAGEYEKAKAEYQKVLNANPKNQEALAQMGRILMAQGNPLRALPYLVQLRELDHKNLEMRTKLLTAFAAFRYTPQVREEAAEILKMDPDHEKALLLLVSMAETPEQLAAANEKIAAAPNRNSVAVHLAEAYPAMKKGLEALRLQQTGSEDAARHHFGTAERAIAKALSVDARSMPALAAQSLLLGLRGDAAGEERICQLITEAAPARTPEWLSLAELHLRRARRMLEVNPSAVENARKLLDAARVLGQDRTAQAPDYLPAWILLANVEQLAKNPAAAGSAAQKVLEIDPIHYDGRVLRCQALLDEGKPQEALVMLEGLTAELAQHPKLEFMLATALVRTGELDKALPVLGSLTAREPNFTEATEAALLLASVKLAKGRAEEVIPELQTVLSRLQDQLQKSSSGGPQPGARAVLNSDIFKGSLLFATALQQAKRFDEAVRVLTELRKGLQPGSNTDTSLLLNLAILYRQAGKPEDARREFEQILKIAPDHIVAIGQLVEFDIASGSFDSALQRLQPLLEKAPVPVEGHLLQGIVFSAQKKWDEAEAALLKALETNPDYEPALRKLIDTYLQAGKSGVALQRLTERLAKHPDDLQSLSAAGLLYEENKDFDKAAQYYEKLLSLKPGLPLILNNLANIYLSHRHDPEKAYQLALEARKLRPEAAAPAAGPPGSTESLTASPGSLAALEPSVIADTLGWIQFKRRNYAEALDLIREAHQSLSANGEVNYHLGLAALMMGDFETARQAFTEALKPEAKLPADFPGRSEMTTYGSLLAGGATPAADIETLAGKDPGNPALALLLARAREAEGDLSKAAAAYQNASTANPRMLPAVIGLARIYSADPAKQAQALELVKNARQYDPAPAQLAELGSIALRAGDHTWAQPVLSLSVGTLGAKAAPSLLEDLAWATYYSGRVVEARKHMQEALSKQATPAVTAVPDLTARATAFLALTGLNEPAAEAALPSAPESVPARLFHAGVLSRQGKAQEAETICKSLLDRYPAFNPAKARLASIYAASEDKREQAKQLASEARLALEQDDPNLTYQSDLLGTLGYLSYLEKDYNRAIQFLERIPAEQVRPEQRFHLGMAQYHSGAKEKGLEQLQAAVQSGLPDPQKAEAAKIIANEQAK